jgi:hypothetical protein
LQDQEEFGLKDPIDNILGEVIDSHGREPLGQAIERGVDGLVDVVERQIGWKCYAHACYAYSVNLSGVFAENLQISANLRPFWQTS